MPAASQQSSGTTEWSAPVSVSPTDRSQLCHMNWGLLLRRDRDFDRLVDELQLLGFPALPGPSAPVVSQRLPATSFESCTLFESPQCSVHMCVEDETVDPSSASSVRNLVSFSTWCVACVRHSVVLHACVIIFGSLRRRCLLLALLFHRCGSALFTRCFDQPSRRSEPRSSGTCLMTSRCSLSGTASMLTTASH